jgi:hypothetical protein
VTPDLFARIDELHRRGKFHGFSIWPTKDGYQVSLATTAPGNWRVRRAELPSEGAELVLAMNYMDDGVKPEPQKIFSDEILAPPAVDEPPYDPGEPPHPVFDQPGIFD